MILIVAAEKIEFDGLVRRAAGVQSQPLGLAFSASAQLGNRPILMVANGPGPRLAGKAMDAVLQNKAISAVVSTGFCGGLDPALHIGDIVTASEVLASPSNQRFRTYSSQTNGTVLSQDRVAVTTAEKHQLWQSTGAAVVEMEAAAVARQAQDRKLPFFCIRVVSDDAHDEMPMDFNEYRDGEGRFARWPVIRAALRQPFARIPALLALQKHCRTAAESLGAFLAECRF